MNRKPDWASILAAEIHLAQHRAFAWGEHDCALMAADIVREMTGSDPMLDLRGRYKSALGARRLLHKLGGLEAAITAQLGAPKGVEYAHQGDVVLYEDPDYGPTAGICLGVPGTSAFTGPTGAVFRPTLKCKCAWSI